MGEARQRLDHLRLITVELTKTRPLYPKTTQEETQREEEFQSLFFFKKRLNIGRTADNAWPRGKKDVDSGKIPLILCVLY